MVVALRKHVKALKVSLGPKRACLSKPLLFFVFKNALSGAKTVPAICKGHLSPGTQTGLKLE